MNFQDYRTLFRVASLASVLLAASPTFSLVFSFPRSEETFSEFWLVGPDDIAENYPLKVSTGVDYSVLLAVGNHIDYSAYYLVHTKFRNQSQPLPDATSSKPSPLPSVYEFRFLVADGEIWERPVSFKILNATFQGDAVVINSVSINDRVFQLDSSSVWDSENSGFYFQLFFELWLYNVEALGLHFHDRYVGIWLNMTG